MRRWLLFPLGLAALAVATLWLVERSPLSEAAKEHLRRVISNGFSLAIVAFLALVALVGLAAPYGLVAAGTLLVSSGAWAASREVWSAELETEEFCPAPGVEIDGFCYTLYSPGG